MHLFLGVGNKIYTEGHSKCYGPFLEGQKNPWEEFEDALNIKKDPQHGKVWNGPDLHKIIDNLDTLEDYIPFYQLELIQAFKSLDQYYQCFCGSTMYSSDLRENVLKDFEQSWDILNKSFGTTYTLKVQIMLEHVNTFVENVGGGLSRRGNDQVTEAAHQLLHQRMIRSHYWVRKVGSESEGKALFKAVVHTNAYNL